MLSFQLAAEGQAMICSTANRALLAYEIAVPHVFGPKKKANKVSNRDGVGESGGDVCVEHQSCACFSLADTIEHDVDCLRRRCVWRSSTRRSIGPMCCRLAFWPTVAPSFPCRAKQVRVEWRFCCWQNHCWDLFFWFFGASPVTLTRALFTLPHHPPSPKLPPRAVCVEHQGRACGGG